ncbi:MAG TPA: di-heme oxidoredictase family protein [Candidatus Sulfotelmatobacter sp.]|nr:di-heme oxidoredictase family protein [Candidatus Sulfotelmatobacter sp.]
MEFLPKTLAIAGCALLLGVAARAQMIDNTQATNKASAGINKSLVDEIGAGRGSVMVPGSSLYMISRDPFRSIRRGRQLFQRKFTQAQGLGPNEGDGVGDLNSDIAIGAGLSDSCAGCHSRPRGSAGSGGNVATRPDSRDAPHLFGLGLKEMIADEMTTDLRATRDLAVKQAQQKKRPVTLRLHSKGVQFGSITANPDGTVDTSQVSGVDTDLRIKPFMAEGSVISMREFIVGALHKEMGLEASSDPDLMAASSGGRVVTPAGMVLDGSKDNITPPPSPDAQNGNEIDAALVDHLEFYLLNYFKPAHHQQNDATERGRSVFDRIGCGSCHISDMTINHDRRVADVETNYNPVNGVFNSLFATASPLFAAKDDGSGFPLLKQPSENPFVVRDIYTDFKRHDLGTNFYERNWEGTLQTEFLTRPLWGVGSTGPYGHDGRSMTLNDVILRHGGEALNSRNAFAALPWYVQQSVIAFLNSLVLFPPDDTASNLDPANPTKPNFPQYGHGSIKLTVLFNDPTDPE